MKRFLLFLLLLIFANRSHAGTELQWNKSLRVTTTALTVTVTNCTSDGSAVITTTGDFRSSGVIPGMNIITGGTLAIPTTAVVLSFNKQALVMSQAATASGTGTATFTTLPRVAPLNIPVVGGINPSDSSGVPLQFDASGNLKVAEQLSPLLNYTTQTIIQGVFAPVLDAQSVAGTYQNRDSSSVIDMRGYNRAAVYLWAQGASAANADSLVGIEFALEIRGHNGTSSDTAGVFRLTNKFYRTSGGTARDSVGSSADYALYTNTYGDSLFKTPMPHEIVVSVPALYSVATAVGQSHLWNRGFVIWTGKVGESGSSNVLPFMSWRLRATKEFILSLTGVPTAMPSGTVGAVRVTATLVLWRD